MIEFSERARAQLLDLQERARPDLILRLFAIPRGCCDFDYGMTFAAPAADDVPVLQGGVRLHVAGDSVARLQGTQIDFGEGTAEGGFSIRNPNARCTCGRGGADSPTGCS